MTCSRITSTRITLLALVSAFLPACSYRGRGAAESVYRQTRAPERPPDVVVSLDGIPFELIREMWEAGAFPGFCAPAKMIAPFPSLSGVGHSDIWQAGGVEGYEDRFYDSAARKVRGGFQERLTNAMPEAWHARYAFEESKFATAFVFLAPHATARKALHEMRAYLRSTDGPRSALLSASDPAAHTFGEHDLRRYVEDAAEAIREAAAGGARVTVFSDHGNDRAPSRKADSASALAQAGMTLAHGGAAGPGHAVVPEYGLVGFAAVHVVPADRERAARALVAAAGVDLVIVDDGEEGARVLSSRGEARVRRAAVAGGRAGIEYVPIAGDPLGLASLRGPIAEDDWLSATADAPYPDAPRRILRAVGGELVHDRAPILLSLASGWHSGPALFARMVRMRGTHGNLGRAQTTGFVLANWTALPDAVRSDDVHRYLIRGIPGIPGPEASHEGILARN